MHTLSTLLPQLMSKSPMRQGVAFPMSVAVDMRKRLAPPLPEHTAGNLVKTAVPLAFDAAQQPLGRLALSLREAIHRWAGAQGSY